MSIWQSYLLLLLLLLLLLVLILFSFCVSFSRTSTNQRRQGRRRVWGRGGRRGRLSLAHTGPRLSLPPPLPAAPPPSPLPTSIPTSPPLPPERRPPPSGRRFLLQEQLWQEARQARWLWEHQKPREQRPLQADLLRQKLSVRQQVRTTTLLRRARWLQIRLQWERSSPF